MTLMDMRTIERTDPPPRRDHHRVVANADRRTEPYMQSQSINSKSAVDLWSPTPTIKPLASIEIVSNLPLTAIGNMNQSGVSSLSISPAGRQRSVGRKKYLTLEIH